MGTPHCIDWGVLADCGEAGRARAILDEDTPWTRLFELAVVQFLSTFRYRAHQAAVRAEDDAELPPDIEFSLGGQHFEMSIERFAVHLGIYYESETVLDDFAQGLTQGEEGVMRAWPCNLARCFALYYASFYHRQERGTLWGGAFITHIARTRGMVDMLDDVPAIEPPGLGRRRARPAAGRWPDTGARADSGGAGPVTAARGGASAASTARLPCGAPDRATRGIVAPDCRPVRPDD
ncbi:hypothetical protein R6Q57_000835 [Mikania cordata]